MRTIILLILICFYIQSYSYQILTKSNDEFNGSIIKSNLEKLYFVDNRNDEILLVIDKEFVSYIFDDSENNIEDIIEFQLPGYVNFNSYGEIIEINDLSDVDKFELSLNPSEKAKYKVIKTENVYIISPTFGALSGLRLGFGRAYYFDSKVWEFSLNYDNEIFSNFSKSKFRVKTLSAFEGDCFYLQGNKFWSPETFRTFMILKLGVFLTEPFFDINENSVSDDLIIVPLLSMGIGYRTDFSENVHFSPSIDIGIQSKIINFEVAFNF